MGLLGRETGFFEIFGLGVFAIYAERRNFKGVNFSDFDEPDDEDGEGGLEGCVRDSGGCENSRFGDVR